MHTKLYIPYIEGLEEDQIALDKIVDSEYIDGIEGELSPEKIHKIHSAKLSYMCKDPFQAEGAALADENFFERFDLDMLEIIAQSDNENILLQGLGNKFIITQKPKKEIKDTIEANSRRFREVTGKKIAFEIHPFTQKVNEHGNSVVYDMLYEPRNLKSILDQSGNGFSFDVPHYLITCENLYCEREKEKPSGNEYKDMVLGCADEKTERFIDTISDYIRHVRVSVPKRDRSGRYEDTASEIDESFTSEIILSMTYDTLQKSKDVESITLDVNKDMLPGEYADFMHEQAEFFTYLMRT